MWSSYALGDSLLCREEITTTTKKPCLPVACPSQLLSSFVCSLYQVHVQLCLILWDPLDCSLLGSSIYGIFQARILEWVTISSSRGFPQPRDRTHVSCIAGRFFICWAIREDCSVQFSSVTQWCPILCDPMDCSRPGFPVHHQVLEFTQTYVHQVNDTIQPSHPLSSPPFPLAFSLSQPQGLLQWVSSLDMHNI